MNALKAASRLYAVRVSWLGDGGEPVARDVASARAAICLACPNNQPRLWENMARHLVSWALGVDRLRSELKLATGVETGLHVCAACDCVLRCKVWVPNEHVEATTDLAALPENCWILTEHNAALTTPSPLALPHA